MFNFFAGNEEENDSYLSDLCGRGQGRMIDILRRSTGRGRRLKNLRWKKNITNLVMRRISQLAGNEERNDSYLLHLCGGGLIRRRTGIESR